MSLDIIKKEAIRQLGWSAQYTDQIAIFYKEFIALRASNGGKYSPPTDVDKFWHIHILNTDEYAEYCMKNFGKIVAHRTTDAIDQPARDLRVKQAEAVLGKIDSGIKITGTCQSQGGRELYNTMGNRVDTPPLQHKTYVHLHFSRSSNGPSMVEAIPFQDKLLLVEQGQSLSKWLINWAKRLGIGEGHLIITQTALNRHHAYFHGMGSNGYC